MLSCFLPFLSLQLFVESPRGRTWKGLLITLFRAPEEKLNLSANSAWSRFWQDNDLRWPCWQQGCLGINPLVPMGYEMYLGGRERKEEGGRKEEKGKKGKEWSRSATTPLWKQPPECLVFLGELWSYPKSLCSGWVWLSRWTWLKPDQWKQCIITPFWSQWRCPSRATKGDLDT